MFYSHEVLQVRKGSLSIVWLAATYRCNKRLLNKRDIEAVDVAEKCSEILSHIVFERTGQKMVFSLYLSAQLMFGLLADLQKLYQKCRCLKSLRDASIDLPGSPHGTTGPAGMPDMHLLPDLINGSFGDEFERFCREADRQFEQETMRLEWALGTNPNLVLNPAEITLREPVEPINRFSDLSGMNREMMQLDSFGDELQLNMGGVDRSLGLLQDQVSLPAELLNAAFGAPAANLRQSPSPTGLRAAHNESILTRVLARIQGEEMQVRTPYSSRERPGVLVTNLAEASTGNSQVAREAGHNGVIDPVSELAPVDLVQVLVEPVLDLENLPAHLLVTPTNKSNRESFDREKAVQSSAIRRVLGPIQLESINASSSENILSGMTLVEETDAQKSQERVPVGNMVVENEENRVPPLAREPSPVVSVKKEKLNKVQDANKKQRKRKLKQDDYIMISNRFMRYQMDNHDDVIEKFEPCFPVRLAKRLRTDLTEEPACSHSNLNFPIVAGELNEKWRECYEHLHQVWASSELEGATLGDATSLSSMPSETFRSRTSALGVSLAEAAMDRSHVLQTTPLIDPAQNENTMGGPGALPLMNESEMQMPPIIESSMATIREFSREDSRVAHPSLLLPLPSPLVADGFSDLKFITTPQELLAKLVARFKENCGEVDSITFSDLCSRETTSRGVAAKIFLFLLVLAKNDEVYLQGVREAEPGAASSDASGPAAGALIHDRIVIKLLVQA